MYSQEIKMCTYPWSVYPKSASWVHIQRAVLQVIDINDGSDYNHSVDMRKKCAKEYKLTQVDLSEKAEVGLRFVRELEQGKTTLRLDKVNKVFELFGSECGPVPMKREE